MDDSEGNSDRNLEMVSTVLLYQQRTHPATVRTFIDTGIVRGKSRKTVARDL
jgi:hypothetical protein